MLPKIYFILKIKIIFYKGGHGGHDRIPACLKEKKIVVLALWLQLSSIQLQSNVLLRHDALRCCLNMHGFPITVYNLLFLSKRISLASFFVKVYLRSLFPEVIIMRQNLKNTYFLMIKT